MPRLTHSLTTLLACIAPVLAASLFLWVLHGATLFDFAPTWSDEVYNWHQTVSFAAVGLETGYYTVAEAKASSSPYYAWGAFTPALYGSIARVLRWHWTSPVLFHSALITLATASLLLITRPTIAQKCLLILTLASFIPLLLFMPTGLQQLLHQSFALVFAAGFYRLLQRDLGRYGFALLIAGILFAGLTRPTWLLLLLPAFVLIAPRKTWRGYLWALLSALPLAAVVALIYQASAAPYPHFRSEFFALLGEDVLRAFRALGRYVLDSLALLTTGFTAAIGQRLQIMLLLVVSAVALLRAMRARHVGTGYIPSAEAVTPAPYTDTLREYGLHLFNLLAAYIATIALHEVLDSRDYRVMAPHLLFSLLLLLLYNRRALLLTMIASMIVLLPAAVDFHEFVSNKYSDMTPAQYQEWNPTVDAVVQYDPDADSAWCNTLLFSLVYMLEFNRPGLLLAFDPGVGLSWLNSVDQLKRPPQSRYLLLTHEHATALQQQVQMQRLFPVPGGNLFINQDAPC